MNKLSKKMKVLIISIILVLISLVYMIINGKNYTIKIDNLNNINSIDEININIEKENGIEIVKCVDKKLENNTLEIEIESVNEGKTFIEINGIGDNYSSFFIIYVHKFGIITFDNFFGDSNGGIILPILILILLIYILYLLIKSYKQNLVKNMYQYKNVTYLGSILFMFFVLINQIIILFNYRGIITIIDSSITIFSNFSFLALPIIFIVSIFVVINNLILITKERLNIRNLLGLLLGTFLCLITIIPEILTNFVQNETFFDVHNQKDLTGFIFLLIETSIYAFVTYLECILVATLILSVRCSKHVPKFNKDFIIILGCRIKKDGTLTKLLKSRVDRAIEFSKMQKDSTGKDLIFVPSGGKGDDEIISEAEAIKKYLVEQGIKETNILIENKSKNTFENIKFSNDLIKKKKINSQIAFATTNYHVFRVGIIAGEQNLNIEGIGAKTKLYFWVNALIREFIAIMFSEKKKHVVMLCSIILVLVFLISLLYVSNTI